MKRGLLFMVSVFIIWRRLYLRRARHFYMDSYVQVFAPQKFKCQFKKVVVDFGLFST